jgi:hypothetical protein
MRLFQNKIESASYSFWSKLTVGARCNYDNSAANDQIYGKLYNFYAVADGRNLAPIGWHVYLEE